MTERNIAELIEKVNELLQADEPANISVDSFSGHTGYKPQYIWNALNKVFGVGCWGFQELSSEVEGEKATLVVSQVEVWLPGVAFHPKAWGQARITKGDIGDARKGAQTDAMKKGFCFFSIGERAYRGLLEKPPEQGDNQPRKLPQRQQSQQLPQPSQSSTRQEPTSQATPPTSTGNNQVDAAAPSPQQLDSIRKMCGMLKRPQVPVVATFADAKTLITTLSQELANKRKAS